jgi:hypothetical protein
MAKKYWMVSPNANNNPKTVPDWKEASIQERMAFMGWESDSKNHLMGPKFAGRNKEGVMPGDVILIARRSVGKPDVVGFGVVRGEYKKIKELKGFRPPKGDSNSGSLRKLRPFVKCGELPNGIPFLDVLPPRGAALRQLHPEKYGNETKYDAHKKVCDWMEKNLREAGEEQHAVSESEDESKWGQDGNGSANSVQSEKVRMEGEMRTVKATIRDPQLRADAKRKYGLKCYCCGFEFARFYGDDAKNIAIVHHLKKFEGKRRKVTINDVMVVCANCHQVIHIRKQPIHVDELKKRISGQWTRWSDDGTKPKPRRRRYRKN